MIRVNARLFAAAAMFVSDEETRYYLQGVSVEPCHEGGALLVATDGHRLICIRDADGEASESAVIQLPKAMLGICVEYVTKYEYDDDDDIESQTRTRCDDRVLVIDNDGRASIDGHLRSYGDCRLTGVKYPDWHKLASKISVGSATPGFNGNYLATFAKCAELLANAPHGFGALRVLYGKENGDPALILFPHAPLAFGVLMPIKVDETQKTEVPSFAMLPRAQAAE